MMIWSKPLLDMSENTLDAVAGINIKDEDETTSQERVELWVKMGHWCSF